MELHVLFQENTHLKNRLFEAETEIQNLKTSRQQRSVGKKTPEKYEKIIYSVQQELDQLRGEKETCDQMLLNYKTMEESNFELQEQLEKIQNYLSESRVREFNSVMPADAAGKLINSLTRDLETDKKKTFNNKNLSRPPETLSLALKSHLSCQTSEAAS